RRPQLGPHFHGYVNLRGGMRSISVLLLMVVVGVDASAQQGLQVTGKVVPTWAWFMNADDEGQMTSGTCFGFGANYHWRDGMGAGIDLIWGTETQVFDPGDGAWTMERSVLKLPVLCHFNSPSADVVPFVGYVGFERVSVRDVAVTGPGGFDPEGVTVNDPNGIGPAFVFHSGELYHKDAWGAVI